MSQIKNSYHHGSLRLSLLNAATELLRETGVAGLSMRKLADQVGVSRAAPYHHFKDKSELLCAIAQQGYELQEIELERATQETPGSSIERLEAITLAYLSFALTHPQHYELMYSGTLWKNGDASTTLRDTSSNRFRLWRREIERLQDAKLLPKTESSQRLAKVSWATMHGLCRFSLDGIYLDTQELKEMGKTAVRVLSQT